MENESTRAKQVAHDTKEVVYTAKAHTVGGRDGGSSKSSDGNLDVKLALPGSKGEGTNPEQLFAAGWSSCYFSALKIEAARLKIRFPKEAFVDAEVDLCLTDGEYTLQARLNVNLPGIDQKIAKSIADAGHKICPYSKAVHGNIKVETVIL